MKTHTDLDTFLKIYAAHPHYRAPRGTDLHALSWQTEAPLRMLLNNLDAEVAEDPAQLVVYGGTGQAARNVECLHRIIARLLRLGDDQSLLIQSGKAVAVCPSHSEAPRVLIANSNLVPQWATWTHFNALQERGLMMFGQMTAGSWIYIGTQGILQGTYETFAEAARKHFGGSLRGRLVVSGGLGGMSGAQPLAATMNDAVFLGVDVDPNRIEKRMATKYLDRSTQDYEEAKRWALEAIEQRRPLSVGLVGDIGTTLRQLLQDNVQVDIATDQTSAHDPLNGYIPTGHSLATAARLRASDPAEYKRQSLHSMATHVEALLALRKRGSVVFEYGNNLRQFAQEGGAKEAFTIPGFVVDYIRPLFCQGKGPFRWVALSGDPEDIYRTDEALCELFPENLALHRWLNAARKYVAFQGLPARVCWLGLGEREKAGLRFNELVRDGVLKAPVVIGRDHLDGGSVASPFRETEGMLDGSDAISDWPLLNLMANGAAGATWVSFHHGGGVGIGFSQHAGMVILADGTPRAERCLKRALFTDPALAVVRHADAGYPEARALANENELIIGDS